MKIEFRKENAETTGDKNPYRRWGIYFNNKIAIGFLNTPIALVPEWYKRYIFFGNVNGNLVWRVLWLIFCIKNYYSNKINKMYY